jgi:hypothetical protein
MQAGDAATLAAANGYTDTRVNAVGAIALGQAQAYADAADAQTLSSANAHADAGDAQTLSSANAHADTGDARTLASANGYTDARFNQAIATPMAEVNALREDMDWNFDRLDRRVDRAGAMTAAMVQMAASAAGIRTPNRVAIGAGFQGGEQAVSIGYQRAISDRATVTVGGAFSDSESSAGVGMGFGW